MTVYAEYAFLDNFTMDCLLLFCAALTLKIPFKKWRVAAGGAVGSITAMLSVFAEGFWVVPIKIICLVAMCITAVGCGKKLFWHILLTLAYTFVTGGAIVGLFNLFKIPYVSENGFCYNMPVPLFVYVLAVAFSAFLCHSIAVFVKQSKTRAPYLVKIRLVLEKPHSVCGFCDSGNSVVCDGLPVCFVTKKFDGVSRYFAQKILQKEHKNVRVATLSGTKTVVAVPAQIILRGKCRDIYLALPAEKCQTQYEVLLHSEFCEVENETVAVT